MKVREYDDWTIGSWRQEPRVRPLDFEEAPVVDQAPPLWKDLTLASFVALLLWAAAATVFG
jgi:hypothetical protein